ncbi:hypothetical protein [Croceimicrobium hydrocarbonivorans]|uniref:Uncharacterized protein n=1 Tax=Croceimicrobium hydrocarbonivorans TaxID=2761580 RepID=A0A7H0VC84_9FLAO|nr:hypothetical protein [Croceimicrobium hydrocarbonivorans]QNR23332.1 hypothetical protein H4K34_13220 [Croceimicrobium hydrocarbonivorans]
MSCLSWACTQIAESEYPSSNTEQVQISEAEFSISEDSTEQELESFPEDVLALIKNSSQDWRPGIKDIDKNDASDSVPAWFVNRYLKGVPVKPDGERLYHESFLPFYWDAYWEDDSLCFFSLVKEDEVCCITLYGFTSTRDSLHIIDAQVLALKGGDGGWTEEDVLEVLSDSSWLRLKQETYLDFDADSGGFAPMFFDTLIMEGYFNREGVFYEITQDSVHKSKIVKLEY